MRTAVATFAPWWVSSVVSCALGCAAGAALSGCTASAEDVRPPQDQLFFPTGMAITPDEKYVFVVNANSELRYDSGALHVIDVATVRQKIADWHGGTDGAGDCTPDPDHIETLVCDEAPFFKKDSGVRVGNFATDLALQDFSSDATTSNQVRLFSPTRGDPSIAWADFNGDKLTCTGSLSDVYPLCDDAHRLTSLNNDPNQTGLAAEPFGVFADKNGGFAMVTHLVISTVTLIRAPADSSQVAIVDMQSGLFGTNLSTGVSDATGIAGLYRPPAAGHAADPDTVYVGSDTENRVWTFSIGQRDAAAAYLLPGNFFFLNAVGGGSGGSSATHGMKFSPDGNQLFVVNRLPPSLQIYDTSLGPTGVPHNTPTGSSDLCPSASNVTVLDLGPSNGTRAYVTCFADGQIYVVDPTGQSQVEDIITVGRGPYSVVAASGVTEPGKPLLFVTNFLEDTIAVIDVAPNSPSRNRVVLRLGVPRPQ